MRLICPRCGAQYEIDAAAVPAGGRDVECSACDHVWRATRPEEPFDPDDRPALSRKLSDSVIEILREEAARELDARAAERQAERATQRTAAVLAQLDAARRGLDETPGSVGPRAEDGPAAPARAAAGGVAPGAFGAVAAGQPGPLSPAAAHPHPDLRVPQEALPDGHGSSSAPANRADRADPADPSGPDRRVPPASLPHGDGPGSDPSVPSAAGVPSQPDPRLAAATAPDGQGFSPDPAIRAAAAARAAGRPTERLHLSDGGSSARAGTAHIQAPPPRRDVDSTRRATVPPAAARARRRHDAGYHVAVMVALAALALYALAPRLADQGRVGATLTHWRAQVDEGRDWLQARGDGAIAWVRAMGPDAASSDPRP